MRVHIVVGGGWGCPLRQGSQGSRFMGGQVFVLGQGGDRLQEQPEQRRREEKGKGQAEIEGQSLKEIVGYF